MGFDWKLESRKHQKLWPPGPVVWTSPSRNSRASLDRSFYDSIGPPWGFEFPLPIDFTSECLCFPVWQTSKNRKKHNQTKKTNCGKLLNLFFLVLRLQKTRYLLFSFPMSRPCAFFPGASGDFMLYRGPMQGGAGTHCAGAFFLIPKFPDVWWSLYVHLFG